MDKSKAKGYFFSILMDSDINRSGQFCEEFLVVGCGLLSISLQTLSWRRRCAPSCENSYVDFELIFALAHNWQMALYIKGLQKSATFYEYQFSSLQTH